MPELCRIEDYFPSMNVTPVELAPVEELLSWKEAKEQVLHTQSEEGNHITKRTEATGGISRQISSDVISLEREATVVAQQNEKPMSVSRGVATTDEISSEMSFERESLLRQVELERSQSRCEREFLLKQVEAERELLQWERKSMMSKFEADFRASKQALYSEKCALEELLRAQGNELLRKVNILCENAQLLCKRGENSSEELQKLDLVVTTPKSTSSLKTSIVPGVLNLKDLSGKSFLMSTPKSSVSLPPMPQTECA